MKTALALLWLLAVPLILASLVVMSDKDVNGVTGLIDVGVAVTVAIMGFADLGLMLIALAAWRRRGFRAFLMLAVPLSIFLALFVTAAGSTATGLTRVGMGLAMAAMIFASFVLALWPVTWVWSRKIDEPEAVV